MKSKPAWAEPVDGTRYQHSGVVPDIITLAKALAGGVAMGGLIASPEVAAKLKPGTHAATFGGNPLACPAALATIETIEADGLLERAVQIGEGFQTRLDARNSAVQRSRKFASREP